MARSHTSVVIGIDVDGPWRSMDMSGRRCPCSGTLNVHSIYIPELIRAYEVYPVENLVMRNLMTEIAAYKFEKIAQKR